MRLFVQCCLFLVRSNDASLPAARKVGLDNGLNDVYIGGNSGGAGWRGVIGGDGDGEVGPKDRLNNVHIDGDIEQVAATHDLSSQAHTRVHIEKEMRYGCCHVKIVLGELNRSLRYRSNCHQCRVRAFQSPATTHA